MTTKSDGVQWPSAGVAEQADAPDSSPGAERREGSIPSSRTPVETLVQFTLEQVDLSSLDDDSFVRLVFAVLDEAQDRDLMRTGCYMHESTPYLTDEQDEMLERGEDPCIPVVWVKP